MKRRLAYIDDNMSNLEATEKIFSNDFSVHVYQNPFDFLSQFQHEKFCAILVDIHLSIMDCFELLEKIVGHDRYDGCPISFIASDDSEMNRIKSFSSVAVDVLDRNKQPDELLVRLKAQILYSQKFRNIIRLGELKLNLTLLKVYLGNEELGLTFTEFKILCHLIKSHPERATKEELIEKVWSNSLVLDATFYTHTFNLNAKITNWEYEVVSERNKGLILSRKAEIE